MDLERPVVLLVLEGDDQSVSRTEIERALSDVATAAISDALDRLTAEGVVYADGERVRASRCARYLDLLGLICA